MAETAGTMAAKSQPTAMKQTLECPVCFDDYDARTRVPKALPCGHTVCAICQQNILHDTGSMCPICNRTNHKTIASLITNCAMLCMVDSMCQECKTFPKVARCLAAHCNKELCEPCKENHLKAFHTDFQQVAKQLQAQITSLQTSSSDDQGLSQMMDEADTVVTEMNRTCQQLQDKIEELKKKTVADIRSTAADAYLAWKDDVNSHLAEANDVSDQLAGNISKTKLTDLQREELYNKWIHLIEVLKTADKTRPAFVHCTIKSTLDDLGPTLTQHLQVTYSEHTMKSQHTPDYKSAQCNREYDLKEPIFITATRPWDISCSPVTGNIAIVAVSGTGVHIVNEQMKLITTIPGGSTGRPGPYTMRKPWGAVISSEDKLFISDVEGHKIQVTDDRGRFLYNIGSQGSGRGQFKSPRGLAMDEDDNLFVCDGYNCRVQVLRPDGSFLRQFSSERSDGVPWFIAASRLHDKVVVSDIGDNLHIFSHKGQLKRIIEANMAPYNMGACGVAMDKSGNVIIVDSKGHRLLVLNDGLEIIASIGSEGPGLGQMSVPQGVAVTPKGDIVVCDQGNIRVQLFQVP